MNKLLLTICLLFIGSIAMEAQTSLEGKVKDKDSSEPIIFTPVALYKNGVLATNVETDLDGNFFFSDIQPGTYDVEVSYVGYATAKLTGVLCKAGQTTRLVIDMQEQSTLLDLVTVTAYKVPLIEIDNTTQGNTITSEKIANLPQKNINGIVANSAGVSSADGSKPNLRGSRDNETIFFIDGIRTSGTIPQSEVEQLQLVTGGIEAKYGDVSGGVISLTSKGPSQKFSGGIEAETSELTDAFGYNLYSANFAGPILKNSKDRSILGFRVSGQYTNIKDNSPSAIGVSRAPLDVIKKLEENPFYNFGTSKNPSSELLRSSDVGSTLKARPTDDNVNINLTGKLDGKISNNIDVSLSGNYEKDKDRNTPVRSFVTNSSSQWAFLNWHNNPYDYTDRLRFNFRLRHKLGKQTDTDSPVESDKVASTSLIRNISYTLLVGYERNKVLKEDYRHEDRFFNYGYFGNYPATFSPVVGFIQGPNGVPSRDHLGYVRITGDFTPNSTINPVLAKYENQTNGVLRQDRSSVWGNLFANVGQVYNNYSKTEDDLYTFNFSTGLDLVPGSSEKGRHSIQFGFIYEQSISRLYQLSPFALWRNADLLANNPLSLAEVDKTALKEINADGDSIFYPVYEKDAQNKFFFKIREKLMLQERDFVNVHSLSPDQLSLDLFSSRELADLNLVDYRGYDYLGNKTSGNISFEDFFTAKDAEGRRSFPVAPFSPIYAAGYIQDKFSYKDIIFRLGLRADYYDANTKVFKDPYAIYDIESAEQYYIRNPDKPKPASVGNDYKVYVKGSASDEIIGYRQGDQWYQPNGTAVSGGNVIFNGGVVYPSYVDRDKRVLDIQDPEFKPEYSFDDYKPQLNLMPRLAFSFPISEDAGFFAHYDVLYQRPPSNSTLSALDYFYFNNASANIQNNPNLKPVRTVSYEAGFQQKVSQYSALKVSAYYKENKDLIQRRVYTNIPAPITTYETYGNLDFGTTKGFSFQFDKRRTNNLEFGATYTLQFADGSGSDANSSNGINNRGIIRNLSPLSFDERHRFTANVDFRYESGKAYDGPVIAGIDVFANAGINLNAIAVSGQPFTRNSIPTQFDGAGFLGAINGSRLPWNFKLDMRIDKKFDLNTSADGKNKLAANVYLRVENLLDAKNVNGVYGFTGDPDNDGYISSSFGQDRLVDVQTTGKSQESFLDAYSWRLISPANYYFPRRMYLGVIFNL